eukprot:2922139-Rhodomonas_salina.7
MRPLVQTARHTPRQYRTARSKRVGSYAHLIWGRDGHVERHILVVAACALSVQPFAKQARRTTVY